MKKSKRFLSLLLGGLMVSSTVLPVTVNAVETDNTKDKADISIYHFYQYSEDPDTGGSWASGPWAQKGESYIPLWEYNPDKTNIADGLVSTNYFRTNDNEITYCLNYGKLVPSSTVYQNEKTSDEVRRVIAKGYPSMQGSDYGISDIELEWATGVALNIVEGNGYNTKGEIVPDTELKLEYFYNDVIDYTYSKKNYPGIPDDVLADYTEKANKVRDVVASLVADASDTSIALNYLNIDTTKASLTSNATSINPEVKYGPFTINTNRTNVDVSLDGETPQNITFSDVDNKKLDSIPLNTPFYISGTASSASTFTMKVSDKSGVCYPEHLYSNDNVAEQSMYVVRSLPLEDEIQLTTNFDVITTTDLKIQKISKETKEPLSGVTFGLYNKNKELLQSLVTDKTGYVSFSEVIPGTYYVKEDSVPAGYIPNNNFIEIVVNDNGVAEGLNNNTLVVENEATKVVLSKTDITNSEPVPGAKITVKDVNDKIVYEGITDNNGNITINAIPAGTYTFTETIAPKGYVLSSETYSFIVKEDGSVSGSTSFTNKPTEVTLTKTDFTTAAPVPGAEITIKDSSDKVVFKDVTDKNGQIKATYLPVGSYTFEETQAPSGYEKLTQTFNFEIKSDGSVVGDTNITNKPTKVTLFKFSNLSSKGLGGAEFKVTNTATKQEYVCTTDDDGYATLTYLPAGKYSWVETKAPVGYAISDKTYYFEISEDGKISGTTKMGDSPIVVTITKKDITNAESVPGAEIAIKDSEGKVVFKDVTDENGQIKAFYLTPGSYFFEEVAAPEGYILSKEVCSFVINEDGTIVGDTSLTNTPTKVVIQKKDEKTGKALEGATIQVKNSKNKVVYTGSTDENGLLTITKLPVGKYTYVETEAPTGYIASSEKFSFEIKEDGTVTGELILYNKAPSVSILKLDAATNKPLAGAVIVVKDRSGKVVFTGETDKNGLVTITGLSVGTYTYTESKAPAGYIVSTRTYTFIIDANGKVSGDTEITNTSTKVVITKRDITNGKVLSDATIEVKDSNNTTVFKGVTDKNGQITIERLPVGTYTFSETVAPKGYELNTETLKFVIAEDGTITGDTEMFDTPSTSTDNPDNPNNPGNPEEPGSPAPSDGTPTTDTGIVKTGQDNNNLALILLCSLSFLTIISMVYYKKRKN